MLQTDQLFPRIDSQKSGVVMNLDTSVDVWFGPTAPKGHESKCRHVLSGQKIVCKFVSIGISRRYKPQLQAAPAICDRELRRSSNA